MRTGKDRVQVDAYQVPVSIGGVLVAPGDVLLGDADGLVAVPSARAPEVLDAARVIPAAEEVTALEDAMSVRIKRGEAVSRVLSADYERMLAGDGGVP